LGRRLPRGHVPPACTGGPASGSPAAAASETTVPSGNTQAGGRLASAVWPAAVRTHALRLTRDGQARTKLVISGLVLILPPRAAADPEEHGLWSAGLPSYCLHCASLDVCGPPSNVIAALSYAGTSPPPLNSPGAQPGEWADPVAAVVGWRRRPGCLSLAWASFRAGRFPCPPRDRRLRREDRAVAPPLSHSTAGLVALMNPLTPSRRGSPGVNLRQWAERHLAGRRRPGSGRSARPLISRLRPQPTPSSASSADTMFSLVPRPGNRWPL